MSKLSIIGLFLLTICAVDNLSSVESTKNGSNPVVYQFEDQFVGGWSTNKTFQYKVSSLEGDSNAIIRTFCTGTFIAPNAILTSAHCCVNVSTSVAVVYLPNAPPPNDDIMAEMSIRKCHTNPAYKSFSLSKDDIAIIELTKNIEWISPVTLDYSEVECGDTVWVYGYSRTELNRTDNGTLVLQQSKLIDNCDDNEMILTYGQNESMCIGDSGGPVFNQNGALVGVHSASSGNCSSANCFNVAVRISSHKQFIQTVLNPNLLIQNSTSYTLYLFLCLAILCLVLCVSILHTPFF